MSFSDAYSNHAGSQPRSVPAWHKYRSMGFTPCWITAVIGSETKPDYWQCRRGCGTLVWDVEAHMKNVCIEWEPVVGRVDRPANPTPALVHCWGDDGPGCGAGVGFITKDAKQITCAACVDILL